MPLNIVVFKDKQEGDVRVWSVVEGTREEYEKNLSSYEEVLDFIVVEGRLADILGVLCDDADFHANCGLQPLCIQLDELLSQVYHIRRSVF